MDNIVKTRIEKLNQSSPVVLYMKGTVDFPQCGFSARAIQILKNLGVTDQKITGINVLEDEEIRSGIKEYSNWPTIPQCYIKGEFVGGSDTMVEMLENGELENLVKGI